MAWRLLSAEEPKLNMQVERKYNQKKMAGFNIHILLLIIQVTLHRPIMPNLFEATSMIKYLISRYPCAELIASAASNPVVLQ